MNEVVNGGQLQHTPTLRDICAIVVTYQPDEEFPERLDHIVQQVDKVVIVDNHSSEICLQMLRETVSQPMVHLIVNDENMGIATALNQGVQYASKCGYPWALTLDQDSLVYPMMVKNLAAAYSDCPFKENVGIIGANLQEQISGKVAIQEKDYGNSSWLEALGAITSGSLISISIFKRIGPFKDDLFIDLVDFEYCLRLRANGYKIIVATKVGMVQAYGDYKKKKLLWINKAVRDYSPLRSYYRTRNGLFLVREYFWKEPLWSLHRLRSLCFRVISIMLFEENKILKIKYTLLGIYHAFISKRGKLI